MKDQRTEFVIRALQCANFRELCREYGISTKTGYKWKHRAEESGLNGLHELSRRPHHHPAELSEETVCRIVSYKLAHRHWGPRKIRALYQRKHPQQASPSESSFKRILEKTGLTDVRKHRRKIMGQRLGEGIKATENNEIWSIDFKGCWKDSEGLKVEPLTVRDEHSRIILAMKLVKNTRTETIRA